MEDLYTVRQLSRRWDRSVQWVHSRIKTGLLNATKTPLGMLITKEEVERFEKETGESKVDLK